MPADSRYSPRGNMTGGNIEKSHVFAAYSCIANPQENRQQYEDGNGGTRYIILLPQTKHAANEISNDGFLILFIYTSQ